MRARLSFVERSALLRFELPAQRLHLCETLRYVAQDGRDSHHVTILVAERQNGEFERDARPILALSRHGQELAGTITRAAGAHHLAISLPMPPAQLLGNNEVERVADRLAGGEAEEPLGALVPELDEAHRIGVDDRIGRLDGELAEEGFLIEGHDIAVNAHACRISP